MRVASAPPLPRRARSGHRSLTGADGAAPRRRARPLDDDTTELVRVFEILLPAGDAVQPVIWLDRHLLD